MVARAKQRPAASRPADNPQASNPTIVGYWHSIFLVDPNSGYSTAGPNVFDEGFDVWHADGSETFNDITIPAAGDVCLGVWAQTGSLTYHLKHPTWLFDMETNTTLIGVGTFQEDITLDPSGNSYAGTIAFNVQDLQGNPLFNFSGTIMAERIVADNQDFMATPGPAPAVTAAVSPQTLTTSQKSVVLDGSGSTSSAGALTYFYSVLPGGKIPAILQSANNPKATVDFVSGPGNYMLQLVVTDAAGNTATSQPIVLTYTGN